MHFFWLHLLQLSRRVWYYIVKGITNLVILKVWVCDYKVRLIPHLLYINQMEKDTTLKVFSSSLRQHKLGISCLA